MFLIDPECFLKPKFFDGAGEKAFAVEKTNTRPKAAVAILDVEIIVVLLCRCKILVCLTNERSGFG